MNTACQKAGSWLIISLQDDDRRGERTQTVVVQQGQQVDVVQVDDDGSSGRSLGTAELVTADVAVMSLGNREPRPQLPLRVLVPAAAGGGRDEQHTSRGQEIDVQQVHDAVDGSAYVALQLTEPAPGWTAARGAGPARDGSVTAGSERPPSTDRWYCHLFPWACR